MADKKTEAVTEKRGILYRLASGDYLRWKPEKILD